MFAWKPSSSAACTTLRRVSGRNWPRPLSALETVPGETPARAATSNTVTTPSRCLRAMAELLFRVRPVKGNHEGKVSAIDDVADVLSAPIDVGLLALLLSRKALSADSPRRKSFRSDRTGWGVSRGDDMAPGTDRPAMPTGISRARAAGAVAAAFLAVVGMTACSSSSTPTSTNPDDGSKLTMWVRSATDQFSQRLVDAYNASHKNHIDLTIIPNDNYLTKVGTAAGSNSLPDILASDVVYTPNYTKQGLFQDITTELKALPYYSSIAQSHLAVASLDGKTYAVPHKLDSSVLFYNKDLFKQAGLDPNKPPTNFT